MPSFSDFLRSLAGYTDQIEPKLDLLKTSVDAVTSQLQNEVVNIDFAHEKIHQGKGFFLVDMVTLSASGSQFWHVKTPNTTTRIHMLFGLEASLSGILRLYAQPTLTNDGTALTPLNSDRNSANASVLSCFRTPTITANGTLFAEQSVGGNNTNARVGGSYEGRNELILKQNTSYLVQFVADANSTRTSIVFNWYEK